MEEYDDNTERDVELSLQSGDWVVKEAKQLLTQYKECKTAHAKNKLRPRLDYIMKRLAFEGKELGKLMGYDEYGNEFGNNEII